MWRNKLSQTFFGSSNVAGGEVDVCSSRLESTKNTAKSMKSEKKHWISRGKRDFLNSPNVFGSASRVAPAVTAGQESTTCTLAAPRASPEEPHARHRAQRRATRLTGGKSGKNRIWQKYPYCSALSPVCLRELFGVRLWAIEACGALGLSRK